MPQPPGSTVSSNPPDRPGVRFSSSAPPADADRLEVRNSASETLPSILVAHIELDIPRSHRRRLGGGALRGQDDVDRSRLIGTGALAVLALGGVQPLAPDTDRRVATAAAPRRRRRVDTTPTAMAAITPRSSMTVADSGSWRPRPLASVLGSRWVRPGQSLLFVRFGGICARLDSPERLISLMRAQDGPAIELPSTGTAHPGGVAFLGRRNTSRAASALDRPPSDHFDPHRVRLDPKHAGHDRRERRAGPTNHERSNACSDPP